jgi:hypothetical protein
MVRISLLVVFGLLACSDAVAPEPDLGTMVYSVFTSCFASGPSYTCNPNQLEVTRGDTLLVGHAVVDTADATGTLSQITIRAPCAVNFEIRRGGDLISTLPPQPPCPDSVLGQGINAPAVNNITVYPWAVPAELPLGTYTLQSVWLEEPAVRRSLNVTVQ